MSFEVREARSGDESGVVAVIRTVYDEFGFAWEEDGYCADLYDLSAHYLDAGHRFWVAEASCGIVGTGALELFESLPGEPGSVAQVEGKPRVAASDCSLERWYVLPEWRSQGVGRALLTRVIETAREVGRSQMEIWSDKRLLEAHRVYERYGAERVGDRILEEDPDKCWEWGFALNLIRADR